MPLQLLLSTVGNLEVSNVERREAHGRLARGSVATAAGGRRAPSMVNPDVVVMRRTGPPGFVAGYPRIEQVGALPIRGGDSVGRARGGGPGRGERERIS